MTGTYPRSLRQALAYLAAHPLVRMTTRYGLIVCRSNWQFRGLSAGVIWFEPCIGQRGGRTGLELCGTCHEVALAFDEGGFHYSRGTVLIRVTYVNHPGGN